MWERRICGKSTTLLGKEKKSYDTDKYKISVPWRLTAYTIRLGKRPSGRLAILRFPWSPKAVSNSHARSHPKAACEHKRDSGESTADVSEAVFRPRFTIT